MKKTRAEMRNTPPPPHTHTHEGIQFKSINRYHCAAEGVCTTRVCSASNSLLCLWPTRKTKLGKDARFKHRITLHPYHRLTPKAFPILQTEDAAAGFVTDCTLGTHRQVAFKPLVRHGDLRTGRKGGQKEV